MSRLTWTGISPLSPEQRASITTWDSLRAQLLAAPHLKGNIWCQRKYLRSAIVISISASSHMLSAQPANPVKMNSHRTHDNPWQQLCFCLPRSCKTGKEEILFFTRRVYFERAPCHSVDLAPNVKVIHLPLRGQAMHQFITSFILSAYFLSQKEDIHCSLPHFESEAIFRKKALNWAIDRSLPIIQLVHKPMSRMTEFSREVMLRWNDNAGNLGCNSRRHV